MPAGRPSKYSPAYVDEVIEFCGQGYSLTAFAGEIGVCRDTITAWCDENPEFSLAVKHAKAKRARWWEDRARTVASEGGPGGQATMVIFGLKNHAPDDYQDITKQQVTGADGKDLIPAEPDRTKLALGILTELREVFAAREEKP